jgi:hypothetical protein
LKEEDVVMVAWVGMNTEEDTCSLVEAPNARNLLQRSQVWNECHDHFPRGLASFPSAANDQEPLDLAVAAWVGMDTEEGICSLVEAPNMQNLL